MDILVNDLMIRYGVTSKSMQSKEILELATNGDHVKSLKLY